MVWRNFSTGSSCSDKISFMIRFGSFFLALVFLFGWRAASASASAEVAPTTATTTENVILLMADGRFYHPASGRTAISRDLLLESIARQMTSSTEPVAAFAAATSSPVLVTDAQTTTSTTSPSTHPLLDAIRRGQQLLREALAGESTSTPTYVKADDGWREIHLALWHRQDDRFSVVWARKSGRSLVCLDEICEEIGVTVTTANGPQSSYKTNDEDVLVVAIRYPLYVEEFVGNKKRRFRVEPIVMTPSSADLLLPEIVEEGERVLDEYVKAAQHFVSVRSIRSRAYPDRLLADVIKPELVKAVIAVEHTDLASLRVNPRSVVDRMFAHLAANPDAPYAADQSSAQALGLAQFIPSTYKHLVASHPELSFVSDFRTGMRNPENAVRAEMAYLDDLLAMLPASARETFLVDPALASEFVVAAYNAGPARVKKTIPLWEEALKAKPKAPLKTLQKMDDRLVDRIERAKKTLATTKMKKQKVVLQSQIAAWRAERVAVRADMAKWNRVSLKAETIAYVKKYREVADLFVPSENKSVLALATEGL